MTENVVGYNTRLAVGAATGTSLPAFAADTYSDVLDIDELTLPSASREVIEYKVLDTKAAKKLVGSITYSAATGTVTRAWGDAIHNRLEDDANAGSAVRRNYRGTLPNTSPQIEYWVGYVSKFEVQGITNDGRIQYAFEVTVDGEKTIVR